MTELIEYSLVFLISSLFVAGSAATYGSFSAMESDIQLHQAFAAISRLAFQALENGSTRATLKLPSSTITCENGLLGVHTVTSAVSQNVPAYCLFEVHVSAGEHQLAFSERDSQLLLQVS
jgi:hypothetical protein